MKKQFVNFFLFFPIALSCMTSTYSQSQGENATRVPEGPVRPQDAIPDDKDFGRTPNGELVRKGTFKALRDNVMILEKLLNLPESEDRKEKIMACVDVLKEIGHDLYSIGIFDWFFTLDEWLQDNQRKARILATLSCVTTFTEKMNKEERKTLQSRLEQLKLSLKAIPEIQILIAEVEKKLAF